MKEFFFQPQYIDNYEILGILSIDENTLSYCGHEKGSKNPKKYEIQEFSKDLMDAKVWGNVSIESESVKHARESEDLKDIFAQVDFYQSDDRKKVYWIRPFEKEFLPLDEFMHIHKNLLWDSKKRIFEHVCEIVEKIFIFLKGRKIRWSTVSPKFFRINVSKMINENEIEIQLAEGFLFKPHDTEFSAPEVDKNNHKDREETAIVYSLCLLLLKFILSNNN